MMGVDVADEFPPRDPALEFCPVPPGVPEADFVGYKCEGCFLPPSFDLPLAGGGVKLEGDEAAEEGFELD